MSDINNGKLEKTIKKSLLPTILLAASLLIGGCAKGDVTPSTAATPASTAATTAATSGAATTKETEALEDEGNLHVRPDVKENGDIVILMTGDMHSGVDKGFTLGGVYEVRYQLELKGDTVLLVDDGDAIQGQPIGFETKGEAVIKLMNNLGYDVAIPGVHEFHYGVDRFFELAEMANFEYISCNFVKNGNRVLNPYVIKEACGKKIAFVGVTTPKALTLLPAEFFQDAGGKNVYGFMQDETGDAVVKAIQESINQARAEGAQYVILMGHIGNEEAAAPWEYNTITYKLKGCDAYLDGYSHDIASETYVDAEGKSRPRVSAGSLLRGLGWIRISAKDGAVTAGVHSWQNNISPMELFDFENPMSKRLDKVMKNFEKSHKQNG